MHTGSELITILGIATGLAMDAFSVCLAAGLVIPEPTRRHYFRLSFHFGLFQFMMPILGYFAGSLVETLIADYDHWVALGLLAAIGGKMVVESFGEKHGGSDTAPDPSRGWSLVVLSIATSIDALAVGLSMGMMAKPILVPSIIIGIICAAFSILGLRLGRHAGALLGNRVERAGGILLIAIGVKIVLEHIGII
ncbi:MAG: manganese efflux pump [Spirochaetes bacterium]|nr:MAG: manganese efflux pump [Spirochaetota bacterium]